jgi:hypothetical protein
LAGFYDNNNNNNDDYYMATKIEVATASNRQSSISLRDILIVTASVV